MSETPATYGGGPVFGAPGSVFGGTLPEPEVRQQGPVIEDAYRPLPTEINYGPVTYRVFVEKGVLPTFPGYLEHAQGAPDDPQDQDGWAWGRTYHHRQEHWISGDLAIGQQWVTLIHEMLHVWEFQTGYKLGSEEQLDSLAHFLMSLAAGRSLDPFDLGKLLANMQLAQDMLNQLTTFSSGFQGDHK